VLCGSVGFFKAVLLCPLVSSSTLVARSSIPPSLFLSPFLLLRLPAGPVHLRLSLARELPLLRHDALVHVLPSLAVPEVNRVSLDVANANHGRAEASGALHEDLGVIEVRDSPHNRRRALHGVVGLEDATPDKHAVHAKLHHEGSVGGCGDAAGGEVHNGELAGRGDLLDELVRRLHVLGGDEKLVIRHSLQVRNLGPNGTRVAHRLDDVAGTRLALGADHTGALGDAAEGFAEVAAAADEGDGELRLVNVVRLVSHREDLRLVDKVNLDGLEDLGLDEVTDADLGHDGDGDGGLDVLNHLRVGGARDAAVAADVGGDLREGRVSKRGQGDFGDNVYAVSSYVISSYVVSSHSHLLKRHNSTRARRLSDLRLLHIHHIHDNSALEHRRKSLCVIVVVVVVVSMVMVNKGMWKCGKGDDDRMMIGLTRPG